MTAAMPPARPPPPANLKEDFDALRLCCSKSLSTLDFNVGNTSYEKTSVSHPFNALLSSPVSR